MISKELFVKCINTLEESWKMATDLDKVFRTYDRDDFINGFGFSDSKVETCLVDVIRDSLGDDKDLISWWCWECEFGKYEPYIYFGDSETPCVILDTPEKLYNFITHNHKEDES